MHVYIAQACQREKAFLLVDIADKQTLWLQMLRGGHAGQVQERRRLTRLARATSTAFLCSPLGGLAVTLLPGRTHALSRRLR